MCQIKLSRLYSVFLVCTYIAGTCGDPYCEQTTSDVPGFSKYKTLCDDEHCVCHDPFGSVHCSCDTQGSPDMVIMSTGRCSLPPETSALIIEKCNNVTVIKGALEGLKGLRTLKLSQINKLQIENRAFHWNETLRQEESGLSIEITNSTVPDIPSYSFRGCIDRVIFKDCYIGMIRSFAFSSVCLTERISFDRCNIANIEAQAFKKFTMNDFIISDSRFNVIPSRFLVDVYVDNLFKINSSFIDVIRTLAFKIYNPKETIVSGSRINKIESEAFKMSTRGPVEIENNIFGNVEGEAFRGMSVEKYIIQQVGRQKFKFQNNTVTNFDDKSFLFNDTAFHVDMPKLLIDEVCTCDNLVFWKDLTKRDAAVDVEIAVEDQIIFIWCHSDGTKELDFDYSSGKQFYLDHCINLISSIYFFVIIITTTALCIVVLILFIVCFVRQRKKWNSVPTSSQDDAGNLKNNKNKSKVEKNSKSKKSEGLDASKAIIVPDGRTYRETEFHVIVEKAEPLDEGLTHYKVVRDRSHTQIN